MRFSVKFYWTLLFRPGSIQTSRQELFVREFECYHRLLLTVFDDIVGKETRCGVIKPCRRSSCCKILVTLYFCRAPSNGGSQLPLIVPNKTVAESVRDQVS
jgi:hypothetical protein